MRLQSRMLEYVVAGLALGGCIDDRVVSADGDAGSSEAGAGSSTTGADAGTTNASATIGSTSPTDPTMGSADDATSMGSSGGGFVPPPDAARGSLECNILTQDCPAGFKCSAWANDGGNAWNAARCTPLAEDPVPVDGSCHVEGSVTSGIDDCEFGAVCYDVDPETLEGTCAPLCVGNGGSDGELYCEDPNRVCYLTGDGAILPCLGLCDPVAQDCPAGEACYAISNFWLCSPDASGDFGAYGDPCEFINVCDPGLICLDTSTVPPGLPCEGMAGCCSEACDITDPAGDQQCAGAAEGQQCVPWYGEGNAPVVLEHVGVCAVP